MCKSLGLYFLGNFKGNFKGNFPSSIPKKKFRFYNKMSTFTAQSV